jgi:hypothetical protein
LTIAPDTFLGERFRRLVKRMPKAKAKAALQRSILTIIFHLLADPTARFEDLGPDFYTRRLDTARRTSQLTRQLQALGYTVTLAPAAWPPQQPRPRSRPGHLGMPSYLPFSGQVVAGVS